MFTSLWLLFEWHCCQATSNHEEDIWLNVRRMKSNCDAMTAMGSRTPQCGLNSPESEPEESKMQNYTNAKYQIIRWYKDTDWTEFLSQTKKDQKCSKVTVHAYNNDKWGSRLASQSGGGTGWWLWYTVVVVQSDGGGGGWWCWYRVGTNYSHLLSHDDLRVTERQEVDQGSTRRRRRWTMDQ